MLKTVVLLNIFVDTMHFTRQFPNTVIKLSNLLIFILVITVCQIQLQLLLGLFKKDISNEDMNPPGQHTKMK